MLERGEAEINSTVNLVSTVRTMLHYCTHTHTHTHTFTHDNGLNTCTRGDLRSRSSEVQLNSVLDLFHYHSQWMGRVNALSLPLCLSHGLLQFTLNSGKELVELRGSLTWNSLCLFILSR